MERNLDASVIAVDYEIMEEMVNALRSDPRLTVWLRHIRKFNPAARDGVFLADSQNNSMMAQRAREKRRARGLRIYSMFNSGAAISIQHEDGTESSIYGMKRLTDFVYQVVYHKEGQEHTPNVYEDRLVIDNELREDFAARMNACVDRREAAAKQARPCPECGTEQVQLTSWLHALNHWRCRKCGHRWQTVPVEAVAVVNSVLKGGLGVIQGVTIVTDEVPK